MGSRKSAARIFERRSGNLEKRMNGDYEIIQSLNIAGSEIVLAHNPKSTLTPYVTWECNPENNSYFWGHYFKDLYAAQKDLVSRGNDKVQFYDKFHRKANKEPERNTDDGR